ncbi:MAG TPA: glycerate kinase [Sphingobacteriaceae bacterium]
MSSRKPIHVLIAPNAFKNALSAPDAAQAVLTGLEQSRLECTAELFPIADGGDGTGKLILEKVRGEVIDVQVQDPLGRMVPASYGLIDGGFTAVIEMAEGSGLKLLQEDEYAPLRTSSFGAGELMRHALDRGVKRMILGMGGSATVDGGMGILQALGMNFLDAEGRLLAGREDRFALNSIDMSHLDPRILETDLVILCDVENPLTGERGAARVFGPQKGASDQDVVKLENFLLKFRDLVLRKTGKDMDVVPRGGTAGGAAAGLWGLLNAQLVSGAEFFLDLTDFNAALERADLLITGEGNIDHQTLEGKGPYIVAQWAKERSVSVIGLAGKVPSVTDNMLEKYFDVLLPIAAQPQELSLLLQNTRPDLIRTSRALGNLLAIGK